MQQLISEQDPNTEQSYLDRVYSCDRAVREEAQIELVQGRLTDVPTLVAILQKENKKKPKRFWFAMLVTEAVIITILLLLSMGSMAGTFTMIAMGAGAAFAPTRLQKAAARRLAEIDDLRAVGPLADALDKQDEGTKKVAIGALKRLLPSMQHSDADLLNSAQRKLLYDTFLGGKADSVRLLLNCLDQIGDGKAVPFVQKLADGKGVAKKNPDVQKSAQECLPVLKEREAAEHARDTLLRAAGASEGGEELLLRPAHDTVASDPALLLRPTLDA